MKRVVRKFNLKEKTRILRKFYRRFLRAFFFEKYTRDMGAVTRGYCDRAIMLYMINDIKGAFNILDEAADKEKRWRNGEKV